MPTPEELARQNIDRLLTACGWRMQKRSEINLDQTLKDWGSSEIRAFPMRLP
jgi:outer membrane lipopolysaccharide assembly protein LptE/RlpB